MSGTTGDAYTQLRLEVKALSKEDRQKLLISAGVTASLDATQALAIKSS